MANGNNGIDEDYFSMVTGIENDTGDTGAEDTGADDGKPADKSTDTSTQQAVDKTTQVNDKQPASKQNEGQGQQSEQVEEVVGQGLRKHSSGQFLDNSGNIVNAEGKLVAKAGPQRRDFERNVKTQNELQSTRQERDSLNTELRSRNYLNNVPQQLGLNTDEVAQGLDYAARIKKGDLLGVAKDIVALVASKGHNISEIVGKDVGDAIDLRAVSAMLDQRLGPITQDRARVEQQSEVERVATQNYNNFVNDNEHADVQGDIIAAFAQNNSVSIQQAYNATREFAVRNGFDFSIPLGPQIEAVMERQQQQQPTNQQQQPAPRTDTRPMPNGVHTHDASAVTPRKPSMANADDDWGTIIRGAMNPN